MPDPACPDSSSPPGELRLLLRIAAPIALAQIAQMAMGVTDSVLLGGLGADALAIGGLSTMLFFTLLVMLQANLGAGGVLIAQARGSGDEGRIASIHAMLLVVALLLCVPFLALLTQAGPLLRLMHQPATLVGPVTSFLHILMWGVPPALIGTGVVEVVLPALDAQGVLLRVMPVVAVVNGVLNAGLIHGWFGLPAMGLRGSALATTLTMWGAALVLLAMVHSRPHLRLLLWPPRPRAADMAVLLRLGVPMMMATGAEIMLFQVTALQAATLGPHALAAHQIVLNLTATTYMAIMALGQAANVRVAYWTGAARPARARHAAWVAVGTAIAGMVASGCLIYLFRARLVAFYLDPSVPANAESTHIAMAALLLAAVFQVADGTQAVLVGALRGRGDAIVPMVLAVLGYWGIGFPLGTWLAFRCGLGVVGLWGGVACALVAVALMLGVRAARTLGDRGPAAVSVSRCRSA
ncbi:MATE family efflux transporter [Gluconacetobacter diazotrophicus]|uniref:Multidrug-efflux transporter n=1 Tax=Gluconacetobacter diazotrophicus (strain ATCC 49037 / DSM 5601 / CCUG 37298 / CIP 103539 / LMG 7603 / PAl5) TaxID=272568 RepID=A9HLA5_GLUDA|nr:MATE family efflux transporter [Gluconacetobacter diazotrophicus]CAP56141.1 putative multidrug resistance protein norM (Multidrug-efflux transporter) [Gluconacetobacter diazotrophicus PA1 5]